MYWARTRDGNRADDTPELFGILQRHLPGDASLLRLAQAELERATMGAEVYPATVSEAKDVWQYVPRDLPKHMVHLPRGWDVFTARDRELILAFATALAPHVRGLVLHDRSDWPERAEAFSTVAADLDRRLAGVPGRPMLFLEYAAGLELEAYASLIEQLASLGQLSACIDTGHVTIFTALRFLSERHPRLEPWTVDPFDPALAPLAPELEEASRQARQDVAALVERVARLGKPMHFHLHDGHPLSRLSRYGVSDHLPFGQPIPVTPALSPNGFLPCLLGPAGLQGIVGAVRTHLAAADVSLTLEIHPNLRLERKPLDEWAPWFGHWNDVANAELTHAWLDQVTQQAELVRRLWSEARA